MAVFVKPGRGTHFDEQTGKIRCFSARSISVMVGWPAPMAWRKTRDRPAWQPFRPRIQVPAGDLDGRIRRLEQPCEENGQLFLPFPGGWPLGADERAELAWLRWFRGIPRDVRRLLAPFPERHWHLLALMARCGPAAIDLVAANPALAFALASSWVFRRSAVQRPLRSARSLLRRGRKQREILSWLGFPGTKSARRILRKVVSSAIGISALLYLRTALGDPRLARTLAHLPRLNRGVLRIATDPALARSATPGLLREIAECRTEDSRPRAAFVLRDVQNLLAVLSPGDRILRSVGSLSRLMELHETLVADMEGSPSIWCSVPFPEAPIPGTESIVPITSYPDLMVEARAQRNCVASYVESIVLHRKTFVYRVLAPERCTLALTRGRQGWSLSELRGACNEEPSPATRKAVGRWFTHLSKATSPSRGEGAGAAAS